MTHIPLGTSLLERLNRLLFRARQAPFYREKYRHFPECLASLEEYASFPVLEKEELREKSIHLCEEMLTSSPKGIMFFLREAPPEAPPMSATLRRSFVGGCLPRDAVLSI